MKKRPTLEEFKEKMMQDKEFREAYEALEEEFAREYELLKKSASILEDQKSS